MIGEAEVAMMTTSMYMGHIMSGSWTAASVVTATVRIRAKGEGAYDREEWWGSMQSGQC